jgi:hypothetical protein
MDLVVAALFLLSLQLCDGFSVLFCFSFKVTRMRYEVKYGHSDTQDHDTTYVSPSQYRCHSDFTRHTADNAR